METALIIQTVFETRSLADLLFTKSLASTDTDLIKHQKIVTECRRSQLNKDETGKLEIGQTKK